MLKVGDLIQRRWKDNDEAYGIPCVVTEVREDLIKIFTVEDGRFVEWYYGNDNGTLESEHCYAEVLGETDIVDRLANTFVNTVGWKREVA